MTTPGIAERLERIAAVTAIKNLMGLYGSYHVTNQHARILDLCAVTTPGIRHDMPFGVYEGRDGLKRLYEGMLGSHDSEPNGRMHMHTMTTPVIVVADDGATAKGVWMSPGHATDKNREGRFEARWRWTRYGVDFVKEDGEWKIWHLRVQGIFATPYEESWVETAAKAGAAPAGPPPLPPEIAPDRPTTGFYQWAPDAVYPDDPAPPLPYATFEEENAY